MRRQIPKYRCFKPKNLGLVVINGKQHYLGRYGSPESVGAYNRLVQEWLEQNQASPARILPAREGPSINDLILAFMTRHADRHYRRPDGTHTGELNNFRDSLRPLRRLYGKTLARHFGPLALKAVRQSMIRAGLARTTINQRVGRIVRLFKWAVENELVPPAVHQALKAVQGLQKGRSEARETEPVKPVPEACVDAIQPFVARQVWAMVQLQRLTGMRPGEVCRMRTCDIDTSGTVWIYSPAVHKTDHLGLERRIYLGPRAQEVLRPWLKSNSSSFLFSPREGVEERLAERRRIRVAAGKKVSGKGTSRTRAPGRAPGETYTTQTYHHAVRRACKRANVPVWHPNQLRHNAATRLRREFGIEVSRVILGHGRLETTEIYAEADRDQAMAVMERVG